MRPRILLLLLLAAGAFSWKRRERKTTIPQAPDGLHNLEVETRFGRMHAVTGAPADAPASPPIVLVHGLIISSAYMVPAARVLARSRRVYAVDMPGYGLSGKPANALSVPELADALVAWMDAVGLQKAVLAGNSYGCQVIVDLAMRHPERVEKIVLQGPTVNPHERTFPQQFWRLLQDGQNSPHSLFPLMLRDYCRAGLRIIIGTVRECMRDVIEEKLPLVTAPALVVRGSLDPMVPQAWAEEATRLLPRGELIVVPGIGHTVNYTAPAEWVGTMRRFLERPLQ